MMTSFSSNVSFFRGFIKAYLLPTIIIIHLIKCKVNAFSIKKELVFKLILLRKYANQDNLFAFLICLQIR